MTAIGKLSVGGMVTIQLSLVVGGRITANTVQIGQGADAVDVSTELAKLSNLADAVQRIVQALQNANITIPGGTGSGGNFGG